MVISKNKVFFVGIILFGFIAGFPLLHNGLIPTHDGEYHVVRFFEFNEVLSDGNWYPRWAPHLNQGYGIPLFNYVYPFPNFFASLLHLFGLSFIDVFKINMLIAWIASGIFFYQWSKIFWGNLGGFVSSILYLYSPYHIADIYVRGSVGEVWALTFFPLFLWAITEYIKKNKTIFFMVSAVSLTLVIFSHNILAVMFFPFALCYALYLVYQHKKKKDVFIKILLIFLFGIGMSAIFWMPALLEGQFVKGLQVFAVQDNFSEIYQFLIPSWGTGFVNGDLGNQMSVQIGMINLFVLLMSIPIAFYLLKRKEKSAFLLFYFIICFSVIFFFMQKFSSSLWSVIPFMNYFQFPWRFLSLIIVVTAFLGGSVIFLKFKKTISALIIVLTVISTIGYTKPAYFLQRNDAYYMKRENFIHGTNSPGNAFNTIWMNSKNKKNNKTILLSENITHIEEKHTKSTEYFVNTTFNAPSQVVAQIAYFPGWKVFINKKEIPVGPNEDGLLTFAVPAGIHLINIKFTDTIVRSIAGMVSIISFLILISVTKRNTYTV